MLFNDALLFCLRVKWSSLNYAKASFGPSFFIITKSRPQIHPKLNVSIFFSFFCFLDLPPFFVDFFCIKNVWELLSQKLSLGDADLRIELSTILISSCLNSIIDYDPIHDIVRTIAILIWVWSIFHSNWSFSISF